MATAAGIPAAAGVSPAALSVPGPPPRVRSPSTPAAEQHRRDRRPGRRAVPRPRDRRHPHHHGLRRRHGRGRDERLRFLPDRTQPADTTASTDATAPSETGQPLVVQPPEANQPAQDQQPPSGQVAKVGETVTVAGLKPEVQVAATLNRVIDNATPDNRFLRPKDGNRFVAVELSLKNVGQEVYTDSPIIGALLIDAEGRQHNAALAGVAEGYPSAEPSPSRSATPAKGSSCSRSRPGRGPRSFSSG
ncbi:DUF4352 domain-containing protein [Streptosporangium lutulentum]